MLKSNLNEDYPIFLGGANYLLPANGFLSLIDSGVNPADAPFDEEAIVKRIGTDHRGAKIIEIVPEDYLAKVAEELNAEAAAQAPVAPVVSAKGSAKVSANEVEPAAEVPAE